MGRISLRRHIVVHEAGHAVVGHLFGRRILAIRAYRRERESWTWLVDPPRTAYWQRREASILYAGRMAEEAILGSHKDLADADYEAMPRLRFDEYDQAAHRAYLLLCRPKVAAAVYALASVLEQREHMSERDAEAIIQEALQG